jgi:hypothetical protein
MLSFFCLQHFLVHVGSEQLLLPTTIKMQLRYNFKVIDYVNGSSEASYVLAIGGMNKRQLYENAYSMMIRKANLLNGSKAIVNVMTEEHISGFAPFFVRRTITVSAQVVEFTR